MFLFGNLQESLEKLSNAQLVNLAQSKPRSRRARIALEILTARNQDLRIKSEIQLNSLVNTFESYMTQFNEVKQTLEEENRYPAHETLLNLQDTNYYLQIEYVLVTLVKDFGLPLIPQDWKQPGRSQTRPDILLKQLLRYGILAVVGDKQQLTSASFRQVIKQYVQCVAHLYRYLVKEFFPSFSNQSSTASYYEAEKFFVVAFKGEVIPVVDTIGQLVIPFVVQHNYRQIVNSELQELADKIFENLAVDSSQFANAKLVELLKPMLTLQLHILLLDKQKGIVPELSSSQQFLWEDWITTIKSESIQLQ